MRSHDISPGDYRLELADSRDDDIIVAYVRERDCYLVGSDRLSNEASGELTSEITE